MRILQECHDSPLGGHLSRRKTAALVRRLAYWPGDVAAYIRSCEVCQRTKARALSILCLSPRVRRDWRRLAGGLTDDLVGLGPGAGTVVRVDHLSGKVHAVPTRATDTAADAARIILKMALRSGDGISRACSSLNSPGASARAC